MRKRRQRTVASHPGAAPAPERRGRCVLRRDLGGLALVLALAVSACTDPTTGPEEEDRVVAGVDLDLLFAPPTQAEVAAVAAEWATRDPVAVDVSIERDMVLEASAGDLRVVVVGHIVDGARHFGAVLAPEALAGPAPVVVYAHGGDGGVAVEDLLFLLPFLGDDATSYVWVIPSFRSESLRFDGAEWISEGAPSPWDGDVDDALALLDVALAVEPSADPDRLAVLGFSRGAGVALLMAIREPRIDRVVEFFGPTDFFDSFIQDVVEEALRGEPRDLPGLSFLDEAYLQPLRRGELTIAQVRPHLVRRSPVLFADGLPSVQVHHGTADDVVEVSQAESLISAMDALGRVEPEFQAFLYEGGGHNPLSLPGSIGATIAFLAELLGAAPARHAEGW